MSRPAELSRSLTLTGLVATGVCSMVGASIHIVPFMIQKNVPGIGPYVVPAFMLAAVPACLAAVAFASLSTAMPRAGGSYIYASRSLSPFLGFVASFSQWFGLSVAIGVVAYIVPSFLRDIFIAMGNQPLTEFAESGIIRIVLPLLLLWGFAWINVTGIKSYQRTVISLMYVSFMLGGIVIAVGIIYNRQDFLDALGGRGGQNLLNLPAPFSFKVLLEASAVLFSSFIGFESIAQAGGEAKEPQRTLPLAILISLTAVSIFYFLFTHAVYQIIPWQFIAGEAQQKNITAPGLLSYVIPPGWAILILAGAAIALIKDLPAMIMSVSRLMFAWANDHIFPARAARIHPIRHTPIVAIVASTLMASVSVFGCYFAGDFFLGIDIMVTSMLVNFILIGVSLLVLPSHNAALARSLKLLKSGAARRIVGLTGIATLGLFLVIHIEKDISLSRPWYFHSVVWWVIAMVCGCVIYWRQVKNNSRAGINFKKIFSELPEE